MIDKNEQMNKRRKNYQAGKFQNRIAFFYGQVYQCGNRGGKKQQPGRFIGFIHVIAYFWNVVAGNGMGMSRPFRKFGSHNFRHPSNWVICNRNRPTASNAEII